MFGNYESLNKKQGENGKREIAVGSIYLIPRNDFGQLLSPAIVKYYETLYIQADLLYLQLHSNESWCLKCSTVKCVSNVKKRYIISNAEQPLYLRTTQKS